MPSSFHCLFCGERIGAYEPVVVVEHDGKQQQASLARDTELDDRTRRFLIHARCAPGATDEDVRMTS